MLSMGLLEIAFIRFSYDTCICNLFWTFFMKRCWILSQDFFASSEMNECVFVCVCCVCVFLTLRNKDNLCDRLSRPTWERGEVCSSRFYLVPLGLQIDREEKRWQIWDWGIGYGGEKGEWRAEACLCFSLAYLCLRKSWLEGFQIVTAGVGKWGKWVSEEGGWRRSV